MPSVRASQRSSVNARSVRDLLSVLRRYDFAPLAMILAYALAASGYGVMFCLDPRVFQLGWRLFRMGTWGACLALVVWALLAPRPVKHLPMLAASYLWIFAIFFIVLDRLPGISGLEGDWFLISIWLTWSAIFLLVFRLAVGFRTNGPTGPTRYSIRHLMLWTALVAITLVVVRNTYPQFVFEEIGTNWASGYVHGWSFMFAWGTLPLTLAGAFRWRLLPLAVANTFVATVAAVVFHYWYFKSAIPSFIDTTCLIEYVASAFHATILLLVSRWLVDDAASQRSIAPA